MYKLVLMLLVNVRFSMGIVYVGYFTVLKRPRLNVSVSWVIVEFIFSCRSITEMASRQSGLYNFLVDYDVWNFF
jgi:hypothetical protein